MRKQLFAERLLLYTVLFISLYGCDKLVEIAPPVNTISTVQVFRNKKNAEAAISGTYSSLSTSGTTMDFGTGAITKYLALYSDELEPTGTDEIDFFKGRINPNDGNLATLLWKSPYSIIYKINAVIEGVAESNNIESQVKDTMIAEMKVLRGISYYYLKSMFGNIPYITTVDWKLSSRIGNTDSGNILDSIINDIEPTVKFLPQDYTRFSGNRTRITQSAAFCLLAKIYLERSDYLNVRKYTDQIRGRADLYLLEDDLRDVFLRSSREAILQWDLNTIEFPWNATSEGYNFNRYVQLPKYFLTDTLLSVFDKSDKRKWDWISVASVSGTPYYFPYKYKLSYLDIDAGKPATELYTVFRFAEVILMSAEASIKLNDLEIGISRINDVRTRSGLEPLPLSLTKDQAMSELLIERQRELFCEWGARFIDLKRMGIANDYFSKVKPDWKESSILFPIPSSELLLNPFLKQNNGY